MAATAEQMLAASLVDSGFPGDKEILDYTFYDTQSFVTTTAQTFTYFESPRNLLTTGNFKGSGAMPSGQAFAVTGLRIILPPATSVADQLAIANGITVTFTVENAKKYFEGLVQDLPAGIGATAENEGNNAGTVGFSNNGIASLGATKRFRYPIFLRTQQPFAITLQTAGITLGSTRAIRVAMDGIFARSVI